jgi:hypothetical protein
VVRLEIDFGAAGFSNDEVLELSIDALSDDKPVMKLWVEVQCCEEPADANG